MKEYTVSVYDDGTKFWYLDGRLHREDGHAVERASGTKCWYVKGQLHREDGPAVEFADGAEQWWLNGELITEEEHKRRTSGVTMEDALAAADGVILREQAERVAELEDRISWLETTLDTVDAALSRWRRVSDES